MGGLTRELIALRVARELKDGTYVNLGVGLPTLVPSFIPKEVQVFLQVENGTLGYGRLAHEEEYDTDVIDSFGQPVTLKPGASFFDLATSFAMMRGGHIDVAILGAYQVSEKGDLANWALPKKRFANVGGAMDLACGAKQVWVMMEHCTSSGEPKIVRECSYPLTAQRVVKLIFTNLAVIEVTPNGLLVREVAPGITLAEVQASTNSTLMVAKDVNGGDSAPKRE
jgi:3-oxoacid CoA-transferase subunit B